MMGSIFSGIASFARVTSCCARSKIPWRRLMKSLRSRCPGGSVSFPHAPEPVGVLVELSLLPLLACLTIGLNLRLFLAGRFPNRFRSRNPS